MSVEEDVMKIQKKLTKMTSEDGTVSVNIDNFKPKNFDRFLSRLYE